MSAYDDREPYSCQHCGIPQYHHGQRWFRGVGVHGWQRPTQLTILVRMVMRKTDPNRWVPQDGRTAWRKWE